MSGNRKEEHRQHKKTSVNGRMQQQRRGNGDKSVRERKRTLHFLPRKRPKGNGEISRDNVWTKIYRNDTK